MKIGNPTGPAPTAAPATEQTAGASGIARPAGDPRPTAVTAATGTEGSQVALSSTATTLLAGTGAASADFDAAKVQRITQAIADGSFRIDAGAIADKLIANAEEVLRSGSPSPGA